MNATPDAAPRGRSPAGNRVHIVNGGHTLAALRRTAVSGEFLVWPDMLMEGPLPVRPDGSLDWPARAAFLSARFGIPRRPALARMRAFARSLAAALRRDAEIVLWFEEDFFCQIHLVYLLATLAGGGPAGRRARLSVLCPAKPLGTLKPETLERLFAARRAPDPGRVALSRKVWSLLAASPLAASWRAESRLAELVRDRRAFLSWPRLRRGLEAHLDRRPASAGPYRGLGSIEAAVVKVLRDGGGRSMAFADVFRGVAAHPRVRPLGVGDLQVARVVRDLAGREDAPIRLLGAGKGATSASGFKSWRLAAAS